jgi:hypothetical protein
MHEFRDLEGRTRVAVICVAIYMVLELLSGLVLLYDYAAAPAFFDPLALRPSELVALPALGMMIVCVVVVGMWIHRASANAHALSDEMTISPGWAVGWYFVPIMNLVRPYQAMREIWMASHFRGNWHGEPAPGILGWWWGLWIVTNILANVSFRLSLNLEPGETLDLVILLDLATAFLNVPLSLALISIMRRTAKAQGDARREETFA